MSNNRVRAARWWVACLLCGVALILCHGEAWAQQSTELAGAGTADFPAGTTFNGITVSGLNFGFGVDLAISGVTGTFEFTVMGLNGAGQLQTIVIEGTATGGSGTAGTGATVVGVCSIDLGDGSAPTTGAPFTMVVTTDGSGQGTLELVVDTETFPLATITTGSVTVDPCQPVLPTLITDSLCAVGAGNIGHNWISLPSHTDLKTARDLCAAIGPTALSVAQKFPDLVSGNATLEGSWIFDCHTETCTPGSASPAYEAGCSASDCFCIDPGEGYDVVVDTPTFFDVDGCESQISITLPAGANTYLISVPIDTTLGTAQQLADAVGLPRQQVFPPTSGGVVIGLDPCTGSFTLCTSGTPACSSIPLVPGRAYEVRFPNTNGSTYVNPTNSTAQCPPGC